MEIRQVAVDVAREALDAAEAAIARPGISLPTNVALPDFYEALDIPARRELLGYALERIIIAPGRGSAASRVTIVERSSSFEAMSDREFEKLSE